MVLGSWLMRCVGEPFDLRGRRAVKGAQLPMMTPHPVHALCYPSCRRPQLSTAIPNVKSKAPILLQV